MRFRTGRINSWPTNGLFHFQDKTHPGNQKSGRNGTTHSHPAGGRDGFFRACPDCWSHELRPGCMVGATPTALDVIPMSALL
jgi:hypothetical protein